MKREVNWIRVIAIIRCNVSLSLVFTTESTEAILVAETHSQNFPTHMLKQSCLFDRSKNIQCGDSNLV